MLGIVPNRSVGTPFRNSSSEGWSVDDFFTTFLRDIVVGRVKVMGEHLCVRDTHKRQ